MIQEAGTSNNTIIMLRAERINLLHLSCRYTTAFIQNGFQQQDTSRSMGWNSKSMEAEMALIMLNCGSRYEKFPE